MKIIKSIEHLSLCNGNSGKLKKLSAVAEAYHSYLQKVVDYYWENNLIPKKFVANLDFDTPLSKRYQQTCGSQAIAVIKSYWSKIQDEVKNRIKNEIKKGNIASEDSKLYYFANKYQLWFETEEKTIELKKKKTSFTIPLTVLTHLTELVLQAKEEISKPQIKNLTLNLDEKVAKLEKGKNSFDYFLRLSTLEMGKPLLIPMTCCFDNTFRFGCQNNKHIKLYENAKRLLKEGELKKIVRLKKRNGEWFASLVIEKEVEVKKCLVAFATNSESSAKATKRSLSLPSNEVRGRILKTKKTSQR